MTETLDGIRVRQDRFLESGKGEGKDNETIWFVHIHSSLLLYLFSDLRNVPLRILTVDASGKAVVNSEALLTEREKFFKIDTSKPYKLNAGTTGVCKQHLQAHR